MTRKASASKKGGKMRDNEGGTDEKGYSEKGEDIEGEVDNKGVGEEDNNAVEANGWR